ncbi:NADH-quinone oxidoreductase subunit NuoE [Isoptericola sp. BMS4]|uniref:NADH-quinone oxidoreductase subunit NuoE n=1 Tax=Isoptericola sp. BMS4 TaxID=2527875 RepID=UPI0014211086|nr:NADH-quinone oxidoreductase subunit NuoE [Isoptericola sp. BMS4]
MTAEPTSARSQARYDAETLASLTADAAQIMARYPDPRSGLLPMLHLVQSVDGYVSRDGIMFCAEQLGMTAAEVSAVATFYTQYKRHPNGTYTVGVCTNTLCAVMGGDAIFEELSEHLGVGHDETTEDGAITLERVECNAACDYAPVVMVNWEFFDNQTPESAAALTDRLRLGEDVAPTRGASSVCSFKRMSRVLAGFPDGRADEGETAGAPTLAGLRLARAASGSVGEGDPSSPGAPSASVVPPSAPARPGQPGDEGSPSPTSGAASASGPAAGRAPGTGEEQQEAEVPPETGAERSSAERKPAATGDESPGRSPSGGKADPEPERKGRDDD